MTERQRIVKRLRHAQALGKLSEEVDALAAEIAKERKRRNGKATPRPQQQRREERNERAVEIRAAVMARADGRCEWCGREGFVLQWAHVIDGNGSRTAHEDETTTAAACADCHLRGWHRNEMPTLRNAKEWALRLGFREALAAIDKKIAKLEEARRTP